MPTISELPAANLISAADEVPISQGGTARSTSVGALLASTQPAIIVDSLSLLGRTSIGAGAPEQVDIGTGIGLSGGTLVANGADHAAFPVASALQPESELVVSNQGSPMLMQASLLRGLFSAGQNVAIDTNGVISATSVGSPGGTAVSAPPISSLQTVGALAAQDLVAVSHAGSDCAVTYSNFLGGVTIDQAQPAGPASAADEIWVAQGSNTMARQTLAVIWQWIVAQLLTYKAPVVEITTNTTLDTTMHNGRILICSQPVTLSPLATNMGSGFQCTVVNASNGNLTLGSGFVSSSGSLVLLPWQSAALTCATYSAGSIAFAAMPAVAATSTPALPGQPFGLSASNVTTTTITIAWQVPATGGSVSSYVIQYRLTGTTAWSTSTSVANATSCQLTSLLPGTSYDIVVAAQNAAGTGAVSTILTVATATTAPATAPPLVSGLTATATSSTAVLLSWAAQSGSNAATTFTVQYRITGSSTWTASVAGMTGTGGTVAGLQASTSYDFAVFGLNGAGAGPLSTPVTAVTRAAPTSVTSITWNLVPSGTYARGSGSIGVNAHVSPASSAVQFGFSTSASTPPSSWTAAVLVNSDLWGAYLPTPTTAGTWYVWGEGLDGSAVTVGSTPFLVQ